MNLQLLHGDCRQVLKTIPDESVHCCVTSPPYWGLRDYGVDGQIGLEATPDAFIAEIVGVFRDVWRVLRKDGTCWINLGDSYAAHPGQRKTTDKAGSKQTSNRGAQGAPSRAPLGLKAKDLCGIPWRAAFALQSAGWYLRQDIIWHKPNPMPESVTDRCTKAHEYVFLLSKSERYYFDQDAIKEPVASATIERSQYKWQRTQNGGGSEESMSGYDYKNNDFGEMKVDLDGGRNKRSVWTVNTRPYKEAHFATFPPALITPMILAGCPVGGTVLDPFGGSGTTGEVAESLGRNSILIELNPAYIEIQGRRTAQMGIAI